MIWESILKRVKVTPKHLDLLEEYIIMWNAPVFPQQYINFLNERNMSHVPHSSNITVAAKKDDRFNIHSTGRDLKIGLRKLKENLRGE